jgi:hypothetical protein
MFGVTCILAPGCKKMNRLSHPLSAFRGRSRTSALEHLSHSWGHLPLLDLDPRWQQWMLYIFVIQKKSCSVRNQNSTDQYPRIKNTIDSLTNQKHDISLWKKAKIVGSHSPDQRVTPLIARLNCCNIRTGCWSKLFPADFHTKLVPDCQHIVN